MESSILVTRTGLDLRCGAGRLGLQGAPGALPSALGFESRERNAKQSSPPEGGLLCFGDPYGTRTQVTAVKGRCLNHLTNGPKKGAARTLRLHGSGTWIRTGDTAGMNRML